MPNIAASNTDATDSNSFNSLFEMLVLDLINVHYGDRVTFNSLFEMLAVYRLRLARRAEALSILYLRCKADYINNQIRNGRVTFNSLFEMRGAVVASQPLLCVDLFQFSI